MTDAETVHPDFLHNEKEFTSITVVDPSVQSRQSLMEFQPGDIVVHRVKRWDNPRIVEKHVSDFNPRTGKVKVIAKNEHTQFQFGAWVDELTHQELDVFQLEKSNEQRFAGMHINTKFILKDVDKTMSKLETKSSICFLFCYHAVKFVFDINVFC